MNILNNDSVNIRNDILSMKSRHEHVKIPIPWTKDYSNFRDAEWGIHGVCRGERNSRKKWAESVQNCFEIRNLLLPRMESVDKKIKVEASGQSLIPFIPVRR